jgi:predicted metalloprotease
MKWEGREESRNVEDRRRMTKRAGIAVGGIGGVVVIVLALMFGIDPSLLLGPGGDPNVNPGGEENKQPLDPEEEKMASFTKVVFRDTEEVWEEQFRKMGKEYDKPTLVLYTGYVQSACGSADSAVGPFYCPADAKVYIDLSFYKDMESKRKLDAPGEFARAYVIAHEVGHHVQRLLGYSQRVDEARRKMSKVEYNKMSVRLELQADYLAGVWAHYGQQKYKFLEEGDIESALGAANAVGDDRLQKKAQGYVVPDSFNHGTSKQRMKWFSKGFKTGNVKEARELFELDYEDL